MTLELRPRLAIQLVGSLAPLSLLGSQTRMGGSCQIACGWLLRVMVAALMALHNKTGPPKGSCFM